MKGGEKRKNKMEKEKILRQYLLNIPTNEYYKLDAEVVVVEKKDRKVWVRMRVTANDEEIVAWHEWLY